MALVVEVLQLLMHCFNRGKRAFTFAIAVAGQSLLALPLCAADTQAVIKIMPLGDSITDGGSYGGYRHLLYRLLAHDGIDFTFVGSLNSGDVPDAHHEGHSGWRIDQIERVVADGWLQTYKPDVVLLHIGTNDIWQHSDLTQAPARLSALIDGILTQSGGTRILVAQILPMTNNASFGNEVREYNAAIADIVRSKTARVSIVNMHDSFSRRDLVDGVHPTKSGYDKMARIWETAILALMH